MMHTTSWMVEGGTKRPYHDLPTTLVGTRYGLQQREQGSVVAGHHNGEQAHASQFYIDR